MLSPCSPPSAGRRQRRRGDGDAEENEEHAERRRQEARPHMHERAGPIGRAFERDAQAEQKHQAASVEVTLAHQLAERAGGRSQFFLPAVCGAVTSLAPIFFETSNYSYMPRCSAVTRCRGVPLTLRDAEPRAEETLPWQVPNDIWHGVWRATAIYIPPKGGDYSRL